MNLEMNPIDSTVQVGQAIADFGILVIIAAAFIVFFFWLGRFFVNSMRKTNERLLEAQAATNKQMEMLVAQNITTQALLNKISDSTNTEALIEQTKYNAENIIRSAFNKNMMDLIVGTTDIIEKNHIVDQDATLKKIKSVVKNAHLSRVKWLNSFKYNNIRLGEYTDHHEWMDKQVDILRKFIYSQDRDIQLLMRELRISYETFTYELNL